MLQRRCLSPNANKPYLEDYEEKAGKRNKEERRSDHVPIGRTAWPKVSTAIQRVTARDWHIIYDSPIAQERFIAMKARDPLVNE